ncbi:MAG: hypothetical protein HY398_00470 [Candidatus Doudnabacteria bacterium]|nr:hypothetical protein [Candidatus Doudnabacteria bacterium]
MNSEQKYVFGSAIADEVARKLLEIGAIKDKSRSPGGLGFRLKLHDVNPDAPLSPYYVDLRIVRSSPPLLRRIGQLLVQRSSGLDYDLLADVPTAATPIVVAMSLITNCPMITPREGKTHGSGSKVDGIFTEGQRVLVVDDLITKGDSKLQAIDCLILAGLVVHDVLVLVDREQGGVAQLQDAGYQVHMVYPFSALVDFYCREGSITEETCAEILIYMAQAMK